MALPDNNYPNAVRRPVLSISMGDGAGIASGLMGEDPWQRSTRSVMTRCAMAPHVDLAMVSLAGDDQAPEVSVANEGDISLGYEDDETTLIFTAVVNNVCDTIHGTRHIEGVNGSTALSRLRINQSYEQQSTGDIVSDLAGQAGVDTDTMESGSDLPFYVVDDRRSVWDHIALLAQKNGYCAYFSTENKLCFGPLSTGQAVQTFAYGNDILAFQSIQAGVSPITFAVVGEGAAGSEGEDAWSWLVKDPASVTAEAGEGAGRQVMAFPALRSTEAVQSAADGLVAAALRRVNAGRVMTAGAPAVTVGSTIEMADLPNDALNGACLAMRVIHEYSKRHGFVSRIDICKPDANGMGGLP